MGSNYFLEKSIRDSTELLRQMQENSRIPSNHFSGATADALKHVWEQQASQMEEMYRQLIMLNDD